MAFALQLDFEALVAQLVAVHEVDGSFRIFRVIKTDKSKPPAAPADLVHKYTAREQISVRLE